MEIVETKVAVLDGIELNDASVSKPFWSAVFSMAMGVAGLIVAEFLPISLLTPMANDLAISEGTAGQMVTATAVIALLSSLLTAVVTKKIDRRTVILAFSVMLIASNLLAAFANNFFVLLTGRLLLGVALGGFWAIAAAVAMRLVPGDQVGKAFSIIFGSVSIATAIAAPLGTYLGELMGWRGTFMLAAVLGVLAFIWQFFAMPSLSPQGNTRLRTLLVVIKRPQIGAGMLAVLLVFGAHMMAFTYLRPFLETIARMSVPGISAVLLAFGIASFMGTTISGPLLKKSLRVFQVGAPVVLVMLAIGLALLGSIGWIASLLVTLWGFTFGSVPVAWSTWLSKAVTDESESAGGLLVANIQLGMAIGAAAGGLVFDFSGAQSIFLAGAVVFLAAVVIISRGIIQKKHIPGR
ncbi:MAG: MFS transporter [Bacteroidota bacterium]|nr:MAG: MFS transporter [Bacteroidota bacterium]